MTARPTAGAGWRRTSTRTCWLTAFDAERGTFVRSYGSRHLDAALLLIPRTGFLPWDDPRAVGTVTAVRDELAADGLVRRYRAGEHTDGLPGTEGAFLACSFWLVDAE
jgi:GH15 family glucan-1,4-alpha-glucosidase